MIGNHSTRKHFTSFLLSVLAYPALHHVQASEVAQQLEYTAPIPLNYVLYVRYGGAWAAQAVPIQLLAQPWLG